MCATIKHHNRVRPFFSYSKPPPSSSLPPNIESDNNLAKPCLSSTQTVLSQTPSSLALQKCIAFLHSCASSIHNLKQIHAFSIKMGVQITNQLMAKHLIFHIVSLSAPMSYAHKVFSQTHHWNVFTWNAMIKGYAESQNPTPAIQIYNQLCSSFVEPDTYTYPFLLKAIAKLTALKEGEKIHCITLKNGLESLLYVQNTLVHMYGCCGQFESAYKVFALMPERDLVAWNTVINGFVLNGRPNEALSVFLDMALEGVKPDGFTVVGLLTACGELGALALGRRIHAYIEKAGLNRNLHASNALLDLYAKCGGITEAKRVFGEIEEKNVVSWNALIVGLAVNGFGEEALGLFKELEMKGLVPTEITFVGVLYACSHCGMVDEGFDYFRTMKEEFGILPTIEHYGCMVDLLGRASLVEKAHNFIENMPLQPNAIIWRSLLAACTIHGHSALAEVVRAKLAQLEPNHSGDYVLLSNLYAAERRWDDVQKLRVEMLSEEVRKSPGHSLVELGNRTYEFTVGDKSHPQSDRVYEKLGEIATLLKLEGYFPHTGNVFADIEEEEKEYAVSYHSEKIAIAFMLINTAPKTPIRVVKNLRICADCHLAIKLISKVYDREIVVRDCSRYHHFSCGACSCKDFW